MKSIITALTLTAALLGPGLAHAQQFPSKPVTIVIPFSPGASNDIFGRYMAEALGKYWKQSVVVENRAGAGGAIGAAYVAKAKPDGYTVMFSSSSYTINSAVQKGLPFDPIKDLKPVAMSMRGQMMVVAGKRVPLPSLKEVVTQAKSQKLFYGGNGASLTTFAAELFNDVAKVKTEQVNYKGGTEALVDLVGGRIDLYFGTVTSILPYIQNKQVIPLAITSKTRASALPDVPTVAEAGFPGAETDIWWGVFAPAATPADIVAKINEGVNAIMSTPEAAEFLAKQSAIPTQSKPDEFAATVVNEITTWRNLAAKNNISSD